MPLEPRILFVTESFNVGGTESHLLNLLPALKEHGFEVAVFCFTEAGSRADQLRDLGIPVHSAPNVGSTGKRSWRAPVRMAGGTAKLFSLTKSFRPSIAHFFLPAPYILGAPVAILAGVPVKIMSRRSMNDYQRNWPGAAGAERLLHKHMDALMGNAKAITDELVTEGVLEQKIHLVYNGVRLAEPKTARQDVRASLGISPDALVAIVVANLHPYKGHEELVTAFAQIADQMPEDWQLLFVGNDAGHRQAIEHAIDDAKLSAHIRLLGERSDIPDLLGAADIGLLTPTRNEGFSNAILETMAAGLPMVVTDVGGNAEAILDGQTGYVEPPHDPNKLGAAILKLAQDAEVRRTMGEAAKKRAIEQFSLSAQTDNYCALYNRLLGRD